MSELDARMLSYDFDEERGFEEPASHDLPGPHALERVITAVLALGLVTLLAGLLGFRQAETTAVVGFGVTTAALAALFVARYRGTIPGIKHDTAGVD